MPVLRGGRQYRRTLVDSHVTLFTLEKNVEIGSNPKTRTVTYRNGRYSREGLLTRYNSFLDSAGEVSSL